MTPAPVRFWYRESTSPMRPVGLIGTLDINNPPMMNPGMVRVRLDPGGRLLEFAAVPPDLAADAGPWAEPDWAPLFAAAGLTMAEWKAAEPLWAPPHATDLRRAWTRETLRIEAGAFRGRPILFRMVPPWRKANDDKPATPTLSLLFRVIFRRPWLAYVAMFAVLAALLSIGPLGWISAVAAMLTIGLAVLVLTRLGLFATLVGIMFSYWAPLSLTTDPSSWFFGWSVITMLVFAAVAVYGFVVSLGGQALFKDSVLGDR